MIKCTLVFIVILASFGDVFSQAKKTDPAPSKNNPHLVVFQQSIGSGDAGTAITALNYYLNEKGSNPAYADTLAMLYMQQGAYPQCFYWTEKRLKVKPDDNSLLELKGICLDKLQQPKEAIDIFEKLFGKSQSPYHAYKLMELQYGIKRLNECLATAELAEKLPYKPSFTMTYNVGQQVGRTYLQAGIYNIHALTLYDLDRKAEAKTYFEKALALDTSFLLAKQNLEAMQSIEMGKGKNNPVPGNQQPSASPANKQN